MKKIITIAAISIISLMFSACSSDDSKYIGYWKGEGNMIFEVLAKNGSDYIIRNINGDLSAKIESGALRGKNELDMEYVMKVKGDSAYYEFGSITTGYARISEDEYGKIRASQVKASIKKN